MKLRTVIFILIIAVLLPSITNANEMALARSYCQYANNSNDKKKTPKALAMCGRLFDALNNQLTEQAEKDCYWRRGAPKTPSCMRNWANRYNQEFGAGSFVYRHDLTSIIYTGIQYQTILRKYKKSDYKDEAEFVVLLKNLIGHPDKIMPRINKFLKDHKRGEWYCKGLLLKARVNEDIWYVHKKWSWIIYNNVLSEDEVIIKSEPYRQEALKLYKQVMKKCKKSFEASAAKKEAAVLSRQQDDFKTYSIVNDSFPGPLSRWGINPPKSSSTPAPSYQPKKRTAPAPLPPATPKKPYGPKVEKKSAPIRYGD